MAKDEAKVQTLLERSSVECTHQTLDLEYAAPHPRREAKAIGKAKKRRSNWEYNRSRTATRSEYICCTAEGLDLAFVANHLKICYDTHDFVATEAYG